MSGTIRRVEVHSPPTPDAHASFSTPRGHPPFVERRLWNIDSGSASVRLDVEGPDDLAPLFAVVSDELAEIGGRANECRAAELGEPRLDFGIGEAGVNGLIELVNNLRRRVLRRTDPKPLARLVTRHEFAQCRNIR